MAANLLKHEKFHSIGVNFNGPKLEEIKQRAVDEVLKVPPILARGDVDHLVEFKDEKLIWKENLLQEMQIGDLMMLRILMSNKLEQQKSTY